MLSGRGASSFNRLYKSVGPDDAGVEEDDENEGADDDEDEENEDVDVVVTGDPTGRINPSSFATTVMSPSLERMSFVENGEELLPTPRRLSIEFEDKPSLNGLLRRDD